MAKPIEPTPILKGEDARRFVKSLANAKYSPEKEARLNRAREAYSKALKRWDVGVAK